MRVSGYLHQAAGRIRNPRQVAGYGEIRSRSVDAVRKVSAFAAKKIVDCVHATKSAACAGINAAWYHTYCVKVAGEFSASVRNASNAALRSVVSLAAM